MSIIDTYYKRVFNSHNEKFSVGSYYPLIIMDELFSHIDKDNTLEKYLINYLQHHKLILCTSDIKQKLIEARRSIKLSILPISQVTINYCFITCYSDKHRFDVNSTIVFLNNIERDTNYNDDWLLSVVLIIDSSVKNDDSNLIAYMQALQKCNMKTKLYVYTYDLVHDNEGIEIESKECLEVLIESITSSIILRSQNFTNNTIKDIELNARTKIKEYTKHLEISDSSKKLQLKWQSTLAKINDKKRDFIVYILSYVFSNVSKLTSGIVFEIAERIDVTQFDLESLIELLEVSFNSIPKISDKQKRLPKHFSFADICIEMFGEEGYKVVEISFKATFAGCVMKASDEDEYLRHAKEIIDKSLSYQHNDVLSTIKSGLIELVSSIEQEIENAENEYDKFIYERFHKAEYDFKDILRGYIRRFIKKEELFAKIDYWNVVGTKINNTLLLKYIDQSEQYRTYSEIKMTLGSYLPSYNFDIPLSDFKDFSVKAALCAIDSNEFIEKLKKMYNERSSSATVCGIKPEWGFVLKYLFQPAISNNEDISFDYGDFQILGEQMYGEYWIFR